MDWLLSHQTALQSWAVLGTFGLVAVWECIRPRRDDVTSLAQRWISNIALTTLGSLLVRWCLPLVAVSVAMFAQQQGWGVLNGIDIPFWMSLPAGVLALDAALYGQHRLMHALPLLWRVHQIHHSDLDFDCGTAIRHHPIESVLGHAFQLGVVLALGVAPVAVLLSEMLQLAVSVFNHGNVTLPAPIERVLRYALVTPDMHRIHHSVAHAEANSNYANLFPWWDRLFSTYRAEPARGHAQMDLGIARARGAHEVTLWKLLLLPFREAEDDGALPPQPASVNPGGMS